jgi:hypothetical protein
MPIRYDCKCQMHHDLRLEDKVYIYALLSCPCTAMASTSVVPNLCEMFVIFVLCHPVFYNCPRLHDYIRILCDHHSEGNHVRQVSLDLLRDLWIHFQVDPHCTSRSISNSSVSAQVPSPSSTFRERMMGWSRFLLRGS